MATDADRSVGEVFSTVAARVLSRYPDDEEGRMLRSAGLKTAGKFYGFATADHLVVKLPASRVADLIEGGKGLPCSPRPGRPMKEWVEIHSLDEESCLSYLLEARAFVSSLAANKHR